MSIDPTRPNVFTCIRRGAAFLLARFAGVVYIQWHERRGRRRLRIVPFPFEVTAMDLIFPDDGLVEQLKRILNGTVKYHLFTNNVTPTLADTVATYTEASWTGYAAVSKTFTDYTINGVSGHNGFAIASPIAFSNTSGSSQNAYGYYVTDSGGTILLAAARFDSAPVSIPNGGSTSVVPVWGDYSQLSS